VFDDELNFQLEDVFSDTSNLDQRSSNQNVQNDGGTFVDVPQRYFGRLSAISMLQPLRTCLQHVPDNSFSYLLGSEMMTQATILSSKEVEESLTRKCCEAFSSYSPYSSFMLETEADRVLKASIGNDPILTFSMDDYDVLDDDLMLMYTVLRIAVGL
jgi:hypothetical protein